MDKELASGEYFLKEKERVAKKKELKKVIKLLGMSPFICSIKLIITHRRPSKLRQ